MDQNDVSKVKNTVSDATHGVKNTIQDATHDMKNNAKDVYHEGKAEELLEAVKKSLGKAGEAVEEAAVEAKHNVKEGVDHIKAHL